MTRIIKGVLVLILMMVFIRANAQKQKVVDTSVGKTFVAMARFKGWTNPGNINSKIVDYKLNDVNTGKPVEVKQGTQWTCDKVEHSDYILSDSGITITVSKTLSDGFGSYWIVKPGILQDNGILSISAFLEKSKFIAKFKKDSIAKYEKEADQRQHDAQMQQNSQDYYNNMVKKYGEEKGTKIFHSELEIGYTKEMVLDAWGSPGPGNINTTTAGDVSTEQWIYNSKNTLLYFTNGVLTSIQK